MATEMETPRYPCPCCGFLQFTEPPGSFQVCLVCGWEDDSLQLQYPGEEGTNPVSLLEGQQNVARIGLCAPQCGGRARGTATGGKREPDWRPLLPGKDEIPRFEAWETLAADGPRSEEDLYYWRPGSWMERRRGQSLQQR